MSKSVKFLIVAFVLCFAMNAFLYPMLPDQMPMQFSLSGEVNYTTPKIIGVSLLPLLALGIAFLRNYLGELDKKNVTVVIVLLVLHCIFTGYVAFFH